MNSAAWWSAAGTAARFVAVCWAIFFVYWAVAAFRVKRTIERSHGAWWRIAAIVLVVWLVTRPRHEATWWSGSEVWVPPFAGRDVIGCIIVACGLAIALWARATLGGNWSGLVVFKEGHELVQRGPYRAVRHPIYSGMLLMILGTALVSGRAAAFIAFAVVFAGFYVKLRMEERLMTRHFPEQYASYRRRTKALIPYVL